MAATIRKMHAPNQLAAVFEVSGSPLENLLYTFTPPIKPQTAPIAYTSFVPGSKYPVIRFVASVMPFLKERKVKNQSVPVAKVAEA